MRWGWRPTANLKEILPIIKTGTALDLGCGCGGNSILLAKNGFKVIALDKNIESTNCLKKRLRNSKTANRITIKSVDLKKSSWPTKKYSLILALNVLHFLSERRATFLINKAKKSLSKNSIIFIRVFSNKNKTVGFSPTPSQMRESFSGFKILHFRHYHVKENHPPKGTHSHWVIDLIAQKK